MPSIKADIIARLQREILPLQGYKSLHTNNDLDIDCGPIKKAFPGARFPLGTIHEFINTTSSKGTPATAGFVSGILSGLMRHGGTALWISSSRTVFPPALSSFGIAPDKIIFIDLQKERDVLWTMEEALKCNGIAAVIGEMKQLDFTVSRRLQLAVEQSRVTGFVLRRGTANTHATTSIARWKITSLQSEVPDEMPGVGFPRWKVELIKVRNGKPGTWIIEWKAGRFRHVSNTDIVVQPIPQRKTG
jgi:protein ImuA